jgi:alkanesulfonate monooxygenase SsuD/methylene tetrahydromethanopterin reductase-like flavin-dependent oxidoreductase (luciferase family)
MTSVRPDRGGGRWPAPDQFTPSQRSSRTPLLGIALLPSVSELPTTIELARVADESGLDLLAVQDHPYNPDHVDTMILIEKLLGVTSRIRVFPDVANVPLRGAAMLAKASTTLDILSNGRFELGLGAGALWPAIRAYGGTELQPKAAVDAFEEAIEVIRGILSAQRGLRLGGEHHALRGAHGGPPPAHPISLWIGASGPRMLSLVGRAGDGWVAPLPTYMSEERVVSAQAQIDAAATSAGRAPSDILRIRQLTGRVTERDSRTNDSEAIVASPTRWAEIVQDQIDRLRFDAIVFWLTDYSAPQVRRFAEEVAPNLRGGEQNAES